MGLDEYSILLGKFLQLLFLEILDKRAVIELTLSFQPVDGGTSYWLGSVGISRIYVSRVM